MTVRVYVPTTPALLRRALDDREVGPAPVVAHAVTDAVRAALPDATEEDREYVASSTAAQASVELLSAEDPPRRLVVAVDVAEAAATGPDDEITRVEVAAVPWRRVTAVLADAADAEPAVGRARDAVLAGSADADLLLELCLDHELGWWATQEVATLLEELRAGGR